MGIRDSELLGRRHRVRRVSTVTPGNTGEADEVEGVDEEAVRETVCGVVVGPGSNWTLGCDAGVDCRTLELTVLVTAVLGVAAETASLVVSMDPVVLVVEEEVCEDCCSWTRRD